MPPATLLETLSHETKDRPSPPPWLFVTDLSLTTLRMVDERGEETTHNHEHHRMASSSTFIPHDNLLLVLVTQKTLQMADETLNRETLPEHRRSNSRNKTLLRTLYTPHGRLCRLPR